VTKTKVIFVVFQLDVGGAERLLLTTIKNMDRESYDVAVCCIVSGGPIADDLQRSGVRLYCLNASPRFYDPRKIYALFRLFRREDPLIVHTHVFAANLYGRIAAILAGVPVVISTEHNIYPNKKKSHIWADRILARYTDRIIAVSQGVRDFTVKQEGIAEGKFIVLHNMVDPKDLVPTDSRNRVREKLGLTDEHVAIGVVASLNVKKGHKYLLAAVSQLVKSHPNIQLLVVGDGPLKEEILALIGELNLRDSVSLLGMRRDIPDLLNAMDIFVLPSLWEGFGIALLEAMVMELPVVATHVGGVGEVITDETGVLVPPGNPQALADALHYLMEHPGQAREMGKKGKERALSIFTADMYVKKLEGLYESLIREKAPGPSSNSENQMAVR
jgi:glycosyltransferase involved in cell wall biosynthesis